MITLVSILRFSAFVGRNKQQKSKTITDGDGACMMKNLYPIYGFIQNDNLKNEFLWLYRR